MTARRRVPFASLLSLLLLGAACGSSSTTVTSPAPAERCGITLNTGATSVPASGGGGTVGVTATRECTWSASVEGGWLSIRSGTSGQGEGTVEFGASPNPDPQARTGAIVVNGSKAQITQAAGECVMTLGSASADLPPAGGATQIEVRASSALCAWTATSDAPWITITSGTTGRGNGSVGITVAATTGPPRVGSLTVAGLQFSVTQSQGCVYAIDRRTHSVSSAGGSGTLAVTTSPACPWTATSNANWITLNPAAGSGPGSVTFSIAGTGGPERTGTALIAGQLFTVTQSPGCAYDVQPTAHTIAAAGGSGGVSVATGPGCGWTATSNAPWITIQGATTGTGPGQLAFSVAATSGPARSGSLTVAGRQVTVTQTQGCSFSISPQSQSVPSSGGSGKVSVTAAPGCAWTATSGASWVSVTSGASGSGNGEVQFSVAATTGPARSATLTIAGQPFTVTQGQGCATTLSPARTDVGDAGGERSFDVQTAAGCAWTASTSATWITITSGASGSGNGTVRFTVAANSGTARTATITAGGQTFTVSQGTGCSVSLSADQQNVPAGGGTGSVNVMAGDGCGWAAETTSPTWLTITSGANGTGNGTVNFAVASNDGAPRQGTLVIGGRSFTVNQASGCSYSINPTQSTIGASGGQLEVDVASGGGCSWTAVSNDPSWIVVTMGQTGNNNGRVRLNVLPNDGADRSGTVVIAGQTFTVSQASGCSFSVAPDTLGGVPASGETRRIEVTSAANCAWTATSNASWITLPPNPGGSGNGGVDVTIAANTDSQVREGTLVVAGRTITVTQQGAAAPPPCVITLTPTSQVVPLAGGTGSIAVSASAGCAWSAVASHDWIRFTSPASGTGEGTVQFSVDAAQAPRAGTITINGHVFTINQQ